MKLGTIKVNKTDYPACLSTRVIINIKQKTGKDFEPGINELLGAGDIEGLFWLMAEMLKAGKRYKDLLGEVSPEPPTEDELIDLVGVDEYSGLVQTIVDTAKTTGDPDVALAGDSKNATATTPTA